MTEDLQFSHHFSMDPVFDSVSALYAYEKLDDADSGVTRELSDSVVLMDFEEIAWNRSKVKSDVMRGWHKEANRFRVKKVRKRINASVCRKGHPLEGNILIHNGANTCKTCNAEYWKEWKQRRKEKKGLNALERL